MISQSHRTTITEQTGILVTEILQIPFSPRLLPDSSHPGMFQVIKHFERSAKKSDRYVPHEPSQSHSVCAVLLLTPLKNDSEDRCR